MTVCIRDEYAMEIIPMTKEKQINGWEKTENRT